MGSRPAGALTTTEIVLPDDVPGPPDFMEAMSAPELAGVDVRLHGTRTTAQDIALSIGRNVLGAPQRYVDANGVDVLRWRFPEPTTAPGQRLTMLDYHSGEPLLVASVTPLSTAEVAVRPAPVSRADRNMRRHATIKDLRSFIEAATTQDPANRAARLFFLDLNCETNPAIMPAMLPPAVMTARMGAMDRAMAALCCRLARRRSGRVGVDRADVPPPDALAAVDDVLVGLLRRHFPGAANGVDVDAVRLAFERFAAGHWSNVEQRAGFPLSNGLPNSALIFLFAEFADVAQTRSAADRELWTALFPVFVDMLGIYRAACTPSRRAFGSYDIKCHRVLDEDSLTAVRAALPSTSMTAAQVLNGLVAEAFSDGWR